MGQLTGSAPPKQRGTPSESGLQHFHLGSMQSQQSSRALPHWFVLFFGPHKPPRGWQPLGLEQAPTGGLVAGSMLQVTFMPPMGATSPPQQSPDFWQRSLVRRQPLAGWQMFTPDSANGAHTRLQQPVHP